MIMEFEEPSFYEELFLKTYGYPLSEYQERNTLSYKEVQSIYKIKVKGHEHVQKSRDRGARDTNTISEADRETWEF